MIKKCYRFFVLHERYSFHLDFKEIIDYHHFYLRSRVETTIWCVCLTIWHWNFLKELNLSQEESIKMHIDNKYTINGASHKSNFSWYKQAY